VVVLLGRSYLIWSPPTTLKRTNWITVWFFFALVFPPYTHYIDGEREVGMHPERGVLVALVFLLGSAGSGYSQSQNAPFNSVVGVTSNQISNPTVTMSQVACSSGLTTWTYFVSATDAAGGSTQGTMAQVMNSGCTSTSLGTTVYSLLTITAPVGAVSCNVYRTSPTATSFNGRIATIPCGGGITATYQDIGGNALDSTTYSSNNSTGSVKAAGTITALNFLSQGSSAGTSDWVQGGAVQTGLLYQVEC